jgi:hypothetical protein
LWIDRCKAKKMQKIDGATVGDANVNFFLHRNRGYD